MIFSRLCCGDWRGRDGRSLKKMNKKVEIIEEFLGFVFIHETKPPYFGGTQNLYRIWIIEGLHKFFKDTLCC